MGCTKYELQTVEGNEAPSEVVITSATKENYVNRLFITLVGRKAQEAEFESSLKTLGDVTIPERKELIQDLMSLPDYDDKLYADVRADYLESVDIPTIYDLYQLALNSLQNDPENDYWKGVKKRMAPLVAVPNDLSTNQIGITEVHKRAIHNPVYDEINMGTENFVVATFQNFLFRYPTQAELESSSQMVDGKSSQIFFENVSSKTDFVEIFFETDDYFEGQVINVFKKYLFREPTSEEMAKYTQQYYTDRDYQKLQTEILSSDEYLFN